MCGLNVLWCFTLFETVFLYGVGCLKGLRVFRGALQRLKEFYGVLTCSDVFALYVLRCV